MTDVDRWEPGTFCWIELGTSDQAGANNFYSGLFGWDANEQDIPGGTYTTFTIRDRGVAAAYTLRDEERSAGVPPHWKSYVSVEDVDQQAKRAEAAGGTILAQPFDVMELGRMAVVQDPTGAVISLWQPGSQAGFGISQEPNTSSWNELMTNDLGRARDYYAELFGWTPQAFPMPSAGEYVVFNNGDVPAAGAMEITAEAKSMGTPPNWMIYISVEDADATAAKTEELGGRVIAPPMDAEGVGRIAIVSDPQGAVFAVIKPAPQPAP